MIPSTPLTPEQRTKLCGGSQGRDRECFPYTKASAPIRTDNSPPRYGNNRAGRYPGLRAVYHQLGPPSHALKVQSGLRGLS